MLEFTLEKYLCFLQHLSFVWAFIWKIEFSDILVCLLTYLGLPSDVGGDLLMKRLARH